MSNPQHQDLELPKPKGWCATYAVAAGVGMITAIVMGYQSAKGMAQAKGGDDDTVPLSGDVLFLGGIFSLFIIPLVLLLVGAVHLVVRLSGKGDDDDGCRGPETATEVSKL
ncbi:hypothetical protein [Nesterenkonia ebinurensis]|uniref:hypothetical protein n=1 Tax=Nesterenkonia ebinurensis TaxID=2608252 RepID=UPI00123E2597|nr:hypothetical protein [Nesterenkonia ebinurensis]